MLFISSIILFISFYGVYFLKAAVLKRKGIDTNKLGKGGKAKNIIAVEKILKLLTYLNACAQGVSIVIYGIYKLHLVSKNIFLSDLLPRTSMKYSGILISVLGIIIFIISVITMRDSWRAGIDNEQNTELITDGIYQYSRNPAFLGFDLFYIGFVFMFPNIILAVISLISMIFFHIQIMEEEKFLSGEFGNAYNEYKKKTPRYFIL